MDTIVIPNFSSFEEHSSTLPKLCEFLRRYMLGNNTLIMQTENAVNEVMNSGSSHSHSNTPKSQYLSGILVVGHYLSNRKHIRNLVVKIQEKVADPIITKKLPPAEYSSIINALITVIKNTHSKDIREKFNSHEEFFMFIEGIHRIVDICIRASKIAAPPPKRDATPSNCIPDAQKTL